jgi:hypothetical protein
MPFKLGKTAARPAAVTFKLVNYLTPALPVPPRKIGHHNLLPIDIGMLGNDSYGDCVWAGAAHESMLWNDMASRQVTFSDQSVLSDYSTVTGFRPNDPNTDNGTDMSDAAKYRQKTGVIDANGVRHKVDAYLALTPGDAVQLRQALYLFGAVGVGVKFPTFWMGKFNAGLEWTYRKNPTFEGGHYISAMGSASPRGAITIATWGTLHTMSTRAYEHYNDESIAYVSLEALTSSGKTLDGFDIDQLRADLRALR